MLKSLADDLVSLFVIRILVVLSKRQRERESVEEVKDFIVDCGYWGTLIKLVAFSFAYPLRIK